MHVAMVHDMLRVVWGEETRDTRQNFNGELELEKEIGSATERDRAVGKLGVVRKLLSIALLTQLIPEAITTNR